MGVWGFGLYSNDDTCDIRDEYIKNIQEIGNDEEAFQKTIDQFCEHVGNDDEPFLWYALAETQWKLGRLMPEVKSKALQWIEQKGGIELWAESKNKGKGWESTLQKLKIKLESPMPPKKEIKKKEDFIRNPWNVGDIYAYQFHTEIAKNYELLGKYILFQKLGNTQLCEWTLSVVQVYDCVFDNLPSVSDLDKIRILPLVYPPNVEGTPSCKDDYIPSFEWYMRAYMVYEKKSHYPKQYFTYIGHCNIQEIKLAGNQMTSFSFEKDRMEDWLCDFYSRWKNIEY